jgi:protein tyrosine phosphatase (PTP) superfamily phosphohydrolase (DUF442 family)
MSGRLDSNQRPPEPHSGALAKLRHAPEDGLAPAFMDDFRHSRPDCNTKRVGLGIGGGGRYIAVGGSGKAVQWIVGRAIFPIFTETAKPSTPCWQLFVTTPVVQKENLDETSENAKKSWIADKDVEGMTATPTELAQVARPRPRRWRRWVWAIVLMAGALPAVEAYSVMFGDNFHAVVAGKVFRCAQPTPGFIKTAVARHGIRTIVNLRGSGDPLDWYLNEARACQDCGISQEDVCFSAGRLPSVNELRRFIEVLDHTEYPILMHCRRGADRTGIASVAAVLLLTDTPVAEARNQLSWRYGHVAIGRPGQLDYLFDIYQDWLDKQGKTHSSAVFRDWACNHYCPGTCWCEIGFSQEPALRVRSDQPSAFHLRVRNASLGPWTLKPQLLAGVHLGCNVWDDHDRKIDTYKTGLRNQIILAGESADFTVVVPPLKAGRYRLQFDMVDEQQCWFFQTGSTPIERELIVHD